jgi:hypothetical protein
MWHVHCSPAPEGDEAPVSKTAAESADGRGLGNTPYSLAFDPDYSVYGK